VGSLRILEAAFVAVVLAATAPHGRGATAPLFEGLDSGSVPTASKSPLAQRYFTQATILVFGFNAAEAARSFDAAIAEDRGCALCYWGLAWSLGPNINADMAAGDAPRVRAALAAARVHSRHASRRDRALIAALASRHPSSREPARPDEEAYAGRMRALARAYPRDAGIATLAAEALMNLHPYDWWQRDGAPQPWTPEIRALLARALAIDPKHPGANHYWLHLVESSPEPADGVASAERLAALVPGAGHLLHMPAHIYMRVGRYGDAIEANRRAIAADERYLAQVDAAGAYRVAYFAHNADFLWAAAAMEGRSAQALAAARAAFPAACGPGRSDRSTGILQQYFVLPYFTLVRFGRWREILEATLPPDVGEPYPLAIWHYARGTALARTGRIDDARRELAALDRLRGDAALEKVRIKNINPASSIVEIARLTLAADIAAAQGRGADAIALLERATAVEDALAYDEPHLWLGPTRHALGAALVGERRYAEAERVYREDLRRYPNNGWSLGGLARAQRLRGDADAASVTERALRDAWARADIAIAGSRF
jgi:tetratricopeptide (TPR) repeat protein